MSLVKIDEFSAHYDGEALARHEMDVSALGPALLAFGDMVREAYTIVDPLDNRSPSVKVQQFQPGSFEVLLGIDLPWLEEAVNLFSGKQITAAVNFGTGVSFLVAAISYAILGVKKLLATGKEVTEDELIEASGDKLVGKRAYQLQKGTRFRGLLKKLVKPLTGEGIDELTLKSRSGDNLVQLTDSEAEELMELETEIEPKVSYEDMIVAVGTPQIDEPTKRQWRLENDQLGSFRARLLDEEFADKVRRGKVSFQRGLRFDAKIRTEEFFGDQNTVSKTKYEIVRMRPIQFEDQQDLFSH